MVRSYAEPVDVRRGDGAPSQFLWRGRLYVVREVLARWMEAGGWWRLKPETSTPGALVDPEREYWRVEATAGISSGTAVVDLCFDWEAGTWTVARSLD